MDHIFNKGCVRNSYVWFHATSISLYLNSSLCSSHVEWFIHHLSCSVVFAVFNSFFIVSRRWSNHQLLHCLHFSLNSLDESVLPERMLFLIIMLIKVFKYICVHCNVLFVSSINNWYIWKHLYQVNIIFFKPFHCVKMCQIYFCLCVLNIVQKYCIFQYVLNLYLGFHNFSN